MNIFEIFTADGKNCYRWVEMGPGVLFSTDPDLADILRDTVLVSRICMLGIIPYAQVLGFSDDHFAVNRFRRGHFAVKHYEISRLSDSDPNQTPLPTHPGIKYVARSPCGDRCTFLERAKSCRTWSRTRSYYVVCFYERHGIWFETSPCGLK